MRLLSARHQVSQKEVLLEFAERPAQLWESGIKTLKKRSQASFAWGVSPCTGCKVSTTALSRFSGSHAGLSEGREIQAVRSSSSSRQPSILGGGIWLSGSFRRSVLLSCGSLQLSGPQQRNQNWYPAVFREAAPGVQRDWRYTRRAGGPYGKCWWAPTNTGSTPEKQQLQLLTALSLQYWEE